MTREHNEASNLVDGFMDFGMTKEEALFASKKVADGRYGEALINAPNGSRVEYWERVIDVLDAMM